MRLPATVPLGAGESLTSHIRRTLNLVGPLPALHGVSGRNTSWLQVTNFADRPAIRSWSNLTEQPGDALAGATFRAFSEALPPIGDVFAGAQTPQGAARRTWLWLGTTQACRLCLRDQRDVWLLLWRLPWVFYCRRHRTILRTHCPSCGSVLREHHGCRSRAHPREWVYLPDSTPPSTPRTPAFAVGNASAAIEQALQGRPQTVLGKELVPAVTYLDALRGLAGLLTHADRYFLVDRPRRLVAAGPRSAARRADLLTEAVITLNKTSEDASASLATRLAHVHPAEGLRPWLYDHCHQNDVTALLIHGIVQTRASIGRQCTPTKIVRPSQVPQLIWPEVWEHLAAMTTASPVTGRAFAAIALVKVSHGGTWIEAAQRLAIPPATARNLCRTGTRSLTTAHATFRQALTDGASQFLVMGTDYQMRRAAIRRLAASPSKVTSTAAALRAPHMRPGLVIERAWTQWALGHPALAPTDRQRPAIERQREAVQRHRWTSQDTKRLTEWLDNHA